VVPSSSILLTDSAAAKPDVQKQWAKSELVPFLVHVTNPEVRSLVHTYSNDIYHHSGDLFDVPDLIPSISVDTNMADVDPFIETSWDFLTQDFSTYDIEVNGAAAGYDMVQLQGRLNIAVDSLNIIAQRGSPFAFDLELSSRVFTPENLLIFASCFFRYSYPELRIVHRPTFKLETAAPELLLGIFLCGSMHAAPTDDALSAGAFFDVSEEFVFQRLEAYLKAYQPEASPPPDREQMLQLNEALSGALLVNCLQYTLNDVETRERNRTLRLPALVSAVRKLGLTKTRHAASTVDELQWSEFIFEETRIRYANGLLSCCGLKVH
jgi:hypothetical protein